MAPRKGNTITLGQKLEIIAAIEKMEKSGKKLNCTQIGRQFDIDRTTVKRISTLRDKIKVDTSNINLSFRRKRGFKEEKVDSALNVWVKECFARNVQLNIHLLRTKAIELAQELGHDFIPSASWLNRFKFRHGVTFKRELYDDMDFQPEDSSCLEEFQTVCVPDILQRYDPNDIFNAEETGLYYEGLPDRGYACTDADFADGLMTKERCTVLLCANMTGSEKSQLLVIGNLKPHVLPRELTTLPVIYRSSKNAWMTSDIFQELLTRWNRKLISDNRKIILLLDNCLADYTASLRFDHIEIVFFPTTHTTQALQPMNMGVIRNLKVHYRIFLNKRIVQAMDMDETKEVADAMKCVTLLDAIYMLDKAWQAVTPEIIKVCFIEAGFGLKCDIGEIAAVPVPENLSQEAFDEIVDQDQDLEVYGDLMEMMIKRQKLDDDHNSEEERTEDLSMIDGSNILDSLNTLRTYLQVKGDRSLLDNFEDIEKEITSDFHYNNSQQRIIKQQRISSSIRS